MSFIAAKEREKLFAEVRTLAEGMRRLCVIRLYASDCAICSFKPFIYENCTFPELALRMTSSKSLMSTR
jgi:hypothetical protein